ncbi:MAG: hypothetical protein R3B06_19810 [Kofleriaceae bacterium]
MGEFRREVLPSRQGRGLLAPLLVLSSTLTVTLGMAIVSAVPHPPRQVRVAPQPVQPVQPRVPAPLPTAPPRYAATPAPPAGVDCAAPVLRPSAETVTEASFEACAQLTGP